MTVRVVSKSSRRSQSPIHEVEQGKTKPNKPRSWVRLVRLSGAAAALTMMGIRRCAGAAYTVYWGLSGQKLAEHLPSALTYVDLLLVIGMLFGFRHALEGLRDLSQEAETLCRGFAGVLGWIEHRIFAVVRRLGL